MSATCGCSMASYKDGDIPDEIAAMAIDDVKIFEGTWEDIKSLCESTDAILEKSGVGFFKRKAMIIATIRREFKVVKVDDKGSPDVYTKTFYPLGIVKELSLPYDDSIVDFKDPDTCDWKIQGVLCNGRLVQKRVGKFGVMYDARCILNNHPDGKTTESPIMCFVWTMVEPNGKKHQATSWLKKVA